MAQSVDTPVHSTAYRIRRALNWFPLGLAYAFFYMGRYNLTVAKSALGDELMSKAQFGTIFGIGAWVYALSFLATGPLTDKLGGRRAMLIATAGTIAVNTAMGAVLYGITNWGWTVSIFWTFTILYAINMHFQSYGAVAIVTVKAPWFHVRERGTFSTIFGAMITLGIFFAFDWGFALVAATRATPSADAGFWARIFGAALGLGGAGVDQNWWLFFTPALMMGACWLAMNQWLCDSPSEAGYADFDTGEESISDDGGRLPVREVFYKIVTHPVLLVICGIEFCSGILRNGVMHWYPLFAAEVGFKKSFWITQNWGLTLLIAGMGGAFLTGWASDKFFQSRRAPMAGILYGVMAVCAAVMAFTLGANPWWGGMATLLISLSVIGVHGILSGTSTTDFGGTRNAGAAVGIVDGMVYLGTGLQSVLIGLITPTGAAAKDPNNWFHWPLFLLPFSVIGFALCLKIWNAAPKKKKAASPATAPAPSPAAVPA
ncbi:MAG: MFS transporter [Elusimicrobia bacterium]|nr:MFS transporter [Elusimicrobiota bacterium]